MMGLLQYYQSIRAQTTADATILPVSAVRRQRRCSLPLRSLRPAFVGKTEAGARRRCPKASRTRSMRAVVQRVLSASVEVEGRVVSEIGPGLLVLVGIHESDKEADADYICRKVLNMRLFPNINSGKAWDQSVMQRNFEVLLVSQFTLYGILKGNKPDFHVAMPPQKANLFYSSVVDRFCKSYNSELVKDGIFGAMMKVNLVNDGPVTMQIESPSRHHEQSAGADADAHADASEAAELQQ